MSSDIQHRFQREGKAMHWVRPRIECAIAASVVFLFLVAAVLSANTLSTEAPIPVLKGITRVLYPNFTDSNSIGHSVAVWLNGDSLSLWRDGDDKDKDKGQKEEQG